MGSSKQNWATPPNLFAGWKEEYGLNLDVCAEAWNAKLPAFITEAQDGLKTPWLLREMAPLYTMGSAEPTSYSRGGYKHPAVAYCNPPYSQTSKWLDKAMDESGRGVFTLMLVPASTGTKWFFDAATKCAFWLFKGRISFVAPPGVEDNHRPNFSPALIEVGGAGRGFLGYRDAKTGAPVYYTGGPFGLKDKVKGESS